MKRAPGRLPGLVMLAEARRFPEGTLREFIAFLRDEQTHFFLLSAVVGVGAGVVALGVRWLGALFTRLAYGDWAGNVVETVRAAPWPLRLLVPAAGALIAGLLVQRVLRRGGASGMSGIMEAVTLRHGFLSLRRTLLFALGSTVALATGSSIGREGPITQVACAFGSRLGRSFRLTEARVRLLVAAGAGAGIAAAYNTPIAGTLFVLEVVAGSFATELVGPTVVAAVVGTLVARIYLWHGPIYDVPDFVLRSPQELLAYAALGIAAGATAAVFLGSLRAGESIFRRLRWPRWATAALGGLVVGALALRLPEVCGNGYDTVVDMLNERVGLTALGLILAGKLIATASSVTSGAPGGVFTPTLFLGAALGGVVGNVVHFAFPETTGTPAMYALVGMGALLAATMHAPMTATVLVAELTGDYVVVLPLLLACGCAAIFTHRMDSVYTRELRRRGISWSGTLEQKIVRSTHARDIMRTEVALLPPETGFDELMRIFTTTRTPCLYVGDAAGNLTGMIELHAVKEILSARELSQVLIAQDLATPPRSVPADASLDEVNEKLWFHDVGEVAVVENGPGSRFLGIVTQRDLLGFLDREILKRNQLLAEVRWRDGLDTGIDYLELPEGYRLQAIDVPSDLLGRTLEEAALRAQHGLNVIAVRSVDRDGNERREPPRLEYRLRSGDRLIVVAASEDVEAFEALRGGG